MLISLILFLWSISASPFTVGTLGVTPVGGRICERWASHPLKSGYGGPRRRAGHSVAPVRVSW